MARGATWDPELEERVGDAIGLELRALGANLTGAVRRFTLDDAGDTGQTVLMIHTIFEGTSEVQQLVIARAISGLRIE